MDYFAFYLLGTPRLTVNHHPITSLSIKAQWLLAMLVLAPGHSMTRDSAAALLWPDSKSANPRGLLRSLLRELRLNLGDAAYRISMGNHKSIALDLTDAFVDALAFDRDIALGDPVSLRRAIALYRSELLGGYHEEWMLEARQHRANAYQEAIRRLNAHSPTRNGEWGGKEDQPQDTASFRQTEEESYNRGTQEVAAAAIKRRLQSMQAQIGELATQIAEMARQLDSLFAAPAPPCDPAKADALCEKGVEALTRGELDIAQEYLLRALAMNPKPLQEARIVDQLGTIAVWYGNQGEARGHFERSFDIRAAKQDQKGLVSSLLRLGDVAESFVIAQEYYLRALQVADYDANVEGMAWSHWSLAGGLISWKQWQPARLPETLYHIRQALQNFAQLHNTPGIVTCMDGVVRLFFELRRAEEAQRMIHAADTVRTAYHIARLSNEQQLFDEELRKAWVSDGNAQKHENTDMLSDTSLQAIIAFVMAQLAKIEM